jgi:hypothetical protein
VKPVVLVLALALGAAMVASGCGGDSDAGRVEATVTTYLRAFADGDGPRACDQLTGEQMRALASMAVEQVPELGATSCVEVVRRFAQQLGSDEKATMREADVFDVTVTGDRATAFVRRGHPVELRLIGGAWLISGGIAER